MQKELSKNGNISSQDTQVSLAAGGVQVERILKQK